MAQINYNKQRNFYVYYSSTHCSVNPDSMKYLKWVAPEALYGFRIISHRAFTPSGRIQSRSIIVFLKRPTFLLVLKCLHYFSGVFYYVKIKLLKYTKNGIVVAFDYKFIKLNLVFETLVKRYDYCSGTLGIKIIYFLFLAYEFKFRE